MTKWRDSRRWPDWGAALCVRGEGAAKRPRTTIVCMGQWGSVVRDLEPVDSAFIGAQKNNPLQKKYSFKKYPRKREMIVLDVVSNSNDGPCVWCRIVTDLKYENPSQSTLLSFFCQKTLRRRPFLPSPPSSRSTLQQQKKLTIGLLRLGGLIPPTNFQSWKWHSKPASPHTRGTRYLNLVTAFSWIIT